MEAIRTQALCKTYRTKVKAPGLKGSLRALARPEYREAQAVKDVSFSVEKGERVAFIGPNGAGKSTLIKMLTGILLPTSGEARVLGMDPARQRRELSYRIGAVFGQKSQMWFHLPPSDSFALLGAIYDMDKATLKKRTDEMTERFGLGEFFSTPVRKLSLGQRMRCEVAASLLHNPEILLLDEPTIGLDVLVKRQIRDIVLEMNRETGCTVFLTSHDAGDVEKLCRRAVVIDKGALVLDRPVSELRHRYFHEKIVSVRFAEETRLTPPDGVLLEKQTAQGARLRVDTRVTGIDEALRWLVSQGVTTDVNVEDPPMESVIASIFSGGEAASHA